MHSESVNMLSALRRVAEAVAVFCKSIQDVNFRWGHPISEEDARKEALAELTLKEEAYYLKAKSIEAWIERVENTWFHDPAICESYLDGGGNMFCVRQTENGPETHNVWRDSTGRIRQSANIKGVHNIEWYRDPKNYKKWPAWRKPPKYDRDDTPGSIFLSLEKFSDFYTFDSREIKKQNEEKKRKKK